MANPPMPTYVTRRVLDGMLRYARSGGDYEVGGFLLGGFHHYDGHRYVDITEQVPALKARSARTHLEFSNDAQKEFHKTLGTRYPGKLVLGWYHTHPAYGIFLSEYDMFIQRGFFAEDHHVAVVFPPLLPVGLWQELERRQFHLVEVPEEEFPSMGTNVLA